MSDEFVSSDNSILDLLRCHESLTVSELSAQTEVTATAVRQRLGRLLAQGLIQRREEGHGRGRPQHRYSLTPAGRRKSGENFADLSAAIWSEIVAIKDEAVRNSVVEGIAKRLAEKYSARVQGRTVEEKMRAIAEMFSERRIPLVVENTNDSPGLTVLACPYPDLAAADPMICSMERAMFSELLGEDMELQGNGSPMSGCCKFEVSHKCS